MGLTGQDTATIPVGAGPEQLQRRQGRVLGELLNTVVPNGFNDPIATPTNPQTINLTGTTPQAASAPPGSASPPALQGPSVVGPATGSVGDGQ